MQDKRKLSCRGKSDNISPGMTVSLHNLDLMVPHEEAALLLSYLQERLYTHASTLCIHTDEDGVMNTPLMATLLHQTVPSPLASLRARDF